MADEPLIRHVKTPRDGNQGTPIQIISGYLKSGFTRGISSLKLHATDKTVALVKPPRFIATPTAKPIANHGIRFKRSDSAPALFTDERGPVHRDSFIPHRRKRITAPRISLTLLGLLLYIIVGIAVFTFASESFKGPKTYKMIDAVYFSIVTLSTIGYGDIVPATTFTKLFTCLFILVGFGFIDTLLDGLVTYALDKQEDVLLGVVDQNHFTKIMETYVLDKNKGRVRIRTKMCLASGVVIFSLVFGTLSAHYTEKLTWIDSFYLSVTSVTTVGYGDFAFKTAEGRCFAIIWLLISTFAVARAFLYLVEYRLEKRTQRTADLVLQKKLTLGDLVAADLDHDGSISKTDYVLFKLREMGKIEDDDIKEIERQFDIMESPDQTNITVADLMESEEKTTDDRG